MFDDSQTEELELTRTAGDEGMTRVTIDSTTAAKLKGLSEVLEFYDEAGNILGRFEPDPHSPAIREWFRNIDHGLSPEELQRRLANRDGISTDELLDRLRRRK